MRAELLPRYPLGQLIAARHVRWYALLLGLFLLACVALSVAVIQSATPEPELLAPFRWVRTYDAG